VRKTALVVTRQGETKALTKVLEECGAAVRLVATCREARDALRLPASVQVVFSDLLLEDGSWRTVRTELARVGSRAPLAVLLPWLDGGAIDLLESGCFEVLAPPYREERIRAVVDRAASLRRADEALPGKTFSAEVAGPAACAVDD
jgi:DNA-binding NtrC family response regulator